jgi:hypothetical protein
LLAADAPLEEAGELDRQVAPTARELGGHLVVVQLSVTVVLNGGSREMDLL